MSLDKLPTLSPGEVCVITTENLDGSTRIVGVVTDFKKKKKVLEKCSHSYKLEVKKLMSIDELEKEEAKHVDTFECHNCGEQCTGEVFYDEEYDYQDPPMWCEKCWNEMNSDDEDEDSDEED